MSNFLWNQGIPLGNFDATTDPTINDDITEGYSKGSIWINCTDGSTFVMIDSTKGAAVWFPLTNGIEGFFLASQGDFGTGGGWADAGFIGANIPVVLYNQNQVERAIFMFYGTARVIFETINPQVAFVVYSDSAPSAGADTVVWELTARYRAQGEVASGPADEVLTQSQVLSTFTANTRQSNLVFDLDKDLIENQDTIHLILRRLGNDASDNYASDVGVGQSGIIVEVLHLNQ